MTKSKQAPIPSPSRRLFVLGAIASATLAACGGAAGGLASVGSGGTGSYASGSISGFGSIIVNQVHYDETSATIIGDDGVVLAAQALQLGMVVDIAGSSVVSQSNGQRHASATDIQVRSEIEGPVSAIDVQAGTFTVLGQTVIVSSSTVFDDDLLGGISSLRTGMIVEVYGFQDTQGRYYASRVDDEDDAVRRYKVRGTVQGLDSAAQQFQIGGITVDYSAVASAVSGLQNGSQVRVELETSGTADATLWRAASLTISTSLVTDQFAADDQIEIELEGIITRFDSRTSFAVNGVTVDASSATRLPGTLALGSRVEVSGIYTQGVLKATEVELDDDDDAGGFELEGTISNLDTAAQVFYIRSARISYATARFSDGTVAQLANGVRVEVEAYLGADGVTLIATEVEFDD